MSAPTFRAYDGAAVVIPAYSATAELPAFLRVLANAHRGRAHGWRVGRFRALLCDVDPAERVEEAGYTIQRDTELSVTTPAGASHRSACYLGPMGRSAAGDCA